MSDTDQAPRESSDNQLGFWVLITLVAIVVYLLSPGPVVKILEVFFHDQEQVLAPYVRAIYAPILWSMDQSDFIEIIYKWYLLDLWGVK